MRGIRLPLSCTRMNAKKEQQLNEKLFQQSINMFNLHTLIIFYNHQKTTRHCCLLAEITTSILSQFHHLNKEYGLDVKLNVEVIRSERRQSVSVWQFLFRKARQLRRFPFNLEIVDGGEEVGGGVISVGYFGGDAVSESLFRQGTLSVDDLQESLVREIRIALQRVFYKTQQQT